MANYPTRSSTPSLVPRACYERPRQPQGPKRFTSAKPRACGISTAQPKVAKGTMVRMPITTVNNAPQVTPVRNGSKLAAIQITTDFRHILTTAEGVSDSHVCTIIVRLTLYPHPPAHGTHLPVCLFKNALITYFLHEIQATGIIVKMEKATREPTTTASV